MSLLDFKNNAPFVSYGTKKIGAMRVVLVDPTDGSEYVASGGTGGGGGTGDASAANQTLQLEVLNDISTKSGQLVTYTDQLETLATANNVSAASIDTKMTATNSSLSSLDTKATARNSSLSSMDGKMTTMNTYLDGLEGLIGTTNTNTGAISTKMDTLLTYTNDVEAQLIAIAAGTQIKGKDAGGTARDIKTTSGGEPIVALKQLTITQVTANLSAATAATILAANADRQGARILNWGSQMVYLTHADSGTPASGAPSDYVPGAVDGVPGQWECGFGPVAGLRGVCAGSASLTVIAW